jgi:hypothetical protein
MSCLTKYSSLAITRTMRTATEPGASEDGIVLRMRTDRLSRYYCRKKHFVPHLTNTMTSEYVGDISQE